MTVSNPVSVIVPVKNAASTLERCILALLGQDYSDGFERLSAALISSAMVTS